MSTLTAPPDRTAQAEQMSPSGTSEPRSRGRTTLDTKVLEKIAAQATTEVAASRGRSGGFLGVGAQADAAARPQVDVELSADFADIEVKVGIGYPGSIRNAAQRIREHVSARVHDLTGVRVRNVDIHVTFVALDTATDNQELR